MKRTQKKWLGTGVLSSAVRRGAAEVERGEFETRMFYRMEIDVNGY